MKILLIEDNPGDARLVKEALAKAKEPVAIEWAATLAKGMALLQKGGLDIVLTDLSLPDSRGLETIFRIQDKAPTLPIVALTGTFDAETGIEAVRQGAEDYLLKEQMDQQLLIRSLRYAVERHRAKIALREKMGELEKMNQIMIDREERILELKEEVRSLKAKLEEGKS